MKKEQSTQDNNALARDRTVLANERTYQAWIRTGLSFFATGLGVVKFLKEEMPLVTVLLITFILLLLSAASFLQAIWRYRDLQIRIAHLDVNTIPLWKIKVTGLALVLCVCLAFIGIFWQNIVLHI